MELPLIVQVTQAQTVGAAPQIIGGIMQPQAHCAHTQGHHRCIGVTSERTNG